MSCGKPHETDCAEVLAEVWLFLDRFTTRPYAIGAIAVSLVLAVGGFAVSTKLAIGDLDPGAPELRADSRYNRDNAYITAHYARSSDQFAVIVKTPKEGCLRYETLVEADRLAWRLRQVEGVLAAADHARDVGDHADLVAADQRLEEILFSAQHAANDLSVFELVVGLHTRLSSGLA